MNDLDKQLQSVKSAVHDFGMKASSSDVTRKQIETVLDRIVVLLESLVEEAKK